MEQKKGKSGKQGPGEEKMQTAYKLSKNLVRDRIRSDSEGDLKLLDEAQKEDVIVVTGTYDHIHLVLEYTGIPFIQVSPENVPKIKFRPDQTVFINCGTSFPSEAARTIAGFVASGGQLITTDWALKHVIEQAFPNTIRYNEKPTRDEVVRIEILDTDDPVLKGFMDEEADPIWWLEGSSYPIQIIDTDNVDILIRSKEIGEKYDEDPVVVRFEHGEGTVYHMISHFYLQRSETRDKKHSEKASSYAIQKGASSSTLKMWQDVEAADEALDYGTVQSANTSAEFVSRAIINQKKKFKEKSD